MQWRRLSHFGLLFNWELRAECRASDPSVPLSLTSRDVPPPGTHSKPIGKVNYDVLQLSVTSITEKQKRQSNLQKGKLFMFCWFRSVSTFCSETLFEIYQDSKPVFLLSHSLDKLSTEMLAWRSNIEIQSSRFCVLPLCTFTTLLLLPTIAFDDFAYQPHCEQLRKTHIVVNDVSAKWIFCMTLLSMEFLNQKVCSCRSGHIYFFKRIISSMI